MQVARNDITADEKDVAATRKDSRPPGKGFTGSGKKSRLSGKSFTVPGDMSQLLGNGSQLPGKRVYDRRENDVAAAGKWFTNAKKRCCSHWEICCSRRGMVHGYLEKGFIAVGKTMLHLLGKLLQLTGNGSRLLGKRFYDFREMMLQPLGNDVAAARKVVHGCWEKGFYVRREIMLQPLEKLFTDAGKKDFTSAGK